MATNPWYTIKRNAHSSLWGTFSKLLADQAGRKSSNLLHMRLYGNLALMGIDGDEYSKQLSLQQNRITLNVVQNVSDTAVALLATNTPKIKFLTSGGDYALKRKADKLTDFVSGEFYKTDIYSKARDAFQDAVIFGTGFLKVYDAGETIEVERVFPDEVYVDDIEGRYGDPRTIYQHKLVDSDFLKDMYPKLEDEINSSGVADGATSTYSFMNYVKPVSVIEAWRLPSGNKSGRHMIITERATLLDEPWEEDCFPIVVFRWNKRPLGFWGQGIPEQLTGVQIEINMILQKIQRHMNLASSKIFLPYGAKLNPGSFSNREWEIIPFSGESAPVPVTIPPIAQEYFAHLDRLYQRAFELTGISQMTAQSTKPEGLNSGKALREFNDIQSRRFLHIGQEWEHFHQEIAKRIISITSHKYEDLKELDPQAEFVVTLETARGLEDIDWSELCLDEDAYRMKAWPTSLLPDTPAGKTQTVQELIQAFPQLQPYALELLDFPDVQDAINKVNAPVKTMENIIYNILEKGQLIHPEPYFDLQLGIQMMQMAYMNAKMDNVPAGKQRLMRQWIEEAMQLLQGIQAAMQPPPGAPVPGPAPGGLPNVQVPGADPNVPVG